MKTMIKNQKGKFQSKLTAFPFKVVKDKQKKVQYRKWAFLFIISNLILFLLFFVWPVTAGLYYSFTDYTGISAKFIGLQNYVELFQDPSFYKSMFRTFFYTVVGVFFVYCISLLVSLLLVSKYTRGKTLAKITLFFPWLISPIVTGVIWRWMFGEGFGFINYMIQSFGGQPLKWFSDGNLAFIVVIFATIWANTAFNMLIFIAALVNIPKTWYEAAEIDGANAWEKFWHVTLPTLRPTSYMVVLLAVFHLMKEFAMVQALTNGGPGTDTTFIVQYIYQTGFDQFRVGYASAASMVLFVVLLFIALLQLYVEKRERV